MSELQVIGAGLKALEQQLDVVAGNLANASTPGYRRSAASIRMFESFLEGGYWDKGQSIPVQTARIDFSPGDTSVTGNALDVAIQSPEGFFEVTLDDGSVGYTRNGRFSRNPTGELATRSGMRVSGEGGGPIVLANTGPISIAEDGTVLVDNESVGKIKVVDFASPEHLKRGRRGTLVAPPEAAIRTMEAPSLQTGAYEGSNVRATKELVRLIEAQRSYERKNRVIKMISDASSALIRAAQS